MFSRSIRYHGRRYTYLRLPGFVAGVAQRIRYLAERGSKDRRAGLILDLRGNMGGLLDEAVLVCRAKVDHAGHSRDRDPA